MMTIWYLVKMTNNMWISCTLRKHWKVPSDLVEKRANKFLVAYLSHIILSYISGIFWAYLGHVSDISRLLVRISSASGVSIFGIFNPFPRVHDLSSDFLTTPTCQLKITMEAVRKLDCRGILYFAVRYQYCIRRLTGGKQAGKLDQSLEGGEQLLISLTLACCCLLLHHQNILGPCSTFS